MIPVGNSMSIPDTGLFFRPSALASFLADHFLIALARVVLSAVNASKAAPVSMELALSLMVHFANRSLNDASMST